MSPIPDSPVGPPWKGCPSPEPSLGIFPKFTRGVRVWTSRKPRSIDSPFLDKGKLKGVLEDPHLKKLFGIIVPEQKSSENNDKVANGAVSFKWIPILN
jgi:hypothetical protein